MIRKMTTPFLIILFTLITFNYADALCVNVPKANVRTGPGKNYDIAWEVYKYMPFLKVGASVSGNWYAVKDLDGDVNWIYRKLVSSKLKCAVVKKAEVNIRKGPGKKYSKTSSGPARQYYSYMVLKKKGAWVQIKDEWNNIGWIHKDYLWQQ